MTPSQGPKQICFVFGMWHLGGGNWEKTSGEASICDQLGFSGRTLERLSGKFRGGLWEVSGRSLEDSGISERLQELLRGVWEVSEKSLGDL